MLALSFNASSSRVGVQADALDREISALRAKIATNGASNQRVQAAAARLGLIVPEPGSVGYLRPRPDDAAVAAKRLASGELTTEPSYSAPAATVSLPTTTSTSPPGDSAPGCDSGGPHDACGRPRCHHDGPRHDHGRPRHHHDGGDQPAGNAKRRRRCVGAVSARLKKGD